MSLSAALPGRSLSKLRAPCSASSGPRARARARRAPRARPTARAAAPRSRPRASAVRLRRARRRWGRASATRRARRRRRRPAGRHGAHRVADARRPARAGSPAATPAGPRSACAPAAPRGAVGQPRSQRRFVAPVGVIGRVAAVVALVGRGRQPPPPVGVAGRDRQPAPGCRDRPRARPRRAPGARRRRGSRPRADRRSRTPGRRRQRDRIRRTPPPRDAARPGGRARPNANSAAEQRRRARPRSPRTRATSSWDDACASKTRVTWWPGTNMDVERRLLRDMGRAVGDHRLIESGDRILVAMSGGKDSYAMCVLLRDLQARAPVRFDLLAVHLDQGQPGYDGAPLASWLAAEGIPHKLLHENTYAIVTDKIPEGKTYCSLCSRLRRGILYSAAGEPRLQQDRARASPRRRAGDAAAEPVLRRQAGVDAAAAGERRRPLRRDPPARVRRRERPGRVRRAAQVPDPALPAVRLAGRTRSASR